MEENIDITLDKLLCKKKLLESDYMLLEESSKSSDSSVRRKVAEACGYNIYTNTKKILINLLNDKDELVRIEVYDSIGASLDINFIDILLVSIANEKKALNRRYAISAYIEIVYNCCSEKKSEAICRLKEWLKNDGNDGCKLACTYGLFLFDNNAYLYDIISYLHNENYQIRSYTINILSDIICKDNSQIIFHAINKLLKHETESYAVEENARRFLVRISKEYKII